MDFLKKPWVIIAILAVLGVGFVLWQSMNGNGLPDGIASGNGRIEAVEIDVATKAAGRIETILANEGDFVEPGQVLAHMDTKQLKAQRLEAAAQLQRAEIAIETAKSLVKQREAEKAAAEAVVAQRKAESDAANRKLQRSETLAERETVSQQVLDNDRAAAEGAKAAVAAAEAQLAATEAAIGAAKSQIVDAKAAVEAAKATIQRVDVEIEDSALKSPRTGRVQYRVAQPGEIISAGGRVLNLVDIGDVFMTFFLPTNEAGRVAIGSEARIVLDAIPDYPIPAEISFVANVAQFTPKTVETREEREKLMFRIKAKISPELLKRYAQYVKTGLPGMTYVKIDPSAEWPENLKARPLPIQQSQAAQ